MDMDRARRPLTEREHAALDFLLSGDDPRLPDLRAQARSAVAIRACGCGCPTVGLAVDTTKAQPVQPGDFEISAVTHDRTEPAQTLWLIAFVREGWLMSLEVAYLEAITDDFPSTDTFAAPSISA